MGESDFMMLQSFPFIAISVIHIFGEAVKSKGIRYSSKPFLIPLLALFYILNAPSASLLLIAALTCGWIGDIFLMIPDYSVRKIWFKLGLLSFLAGHLFYTTAFFQKGSSSGFTLSGGILSVVFVIFGVVVFIKMRAFLGRLLIPVSLYILVISLMGTSTAFCFGSQPWASVVLAASGSLIFMISDTMNAWNRFVRNIPNERVLTMSTYLIGQFLLILGYLQFLS